MASTTSQREAPDVPCSKHRDYHGQRPMAEQLPRPKCGDSRRAELKRQKQTPLEMRIMGKVLEDVGHRGQDRKGLWIKR